MRTVVFLLFLLCSYLHGATPDTAVAAMTIEFPEKAGGPAWVRIPYRKIGNLILLEAEIDSIRGNFILDTGAPGLVLNRTYFREYINEEYAFNGGGITGGASTTGSAEIEGLMLHGISYSLLHADVIPLGHLESSRKVKILGLLGTGVFDGKEVVIDDQQEVLHIFSLNLRGQRLANIDTIPTWKATETQPMTQISGIFMVQGRIGGQKLRFCLDTGAENTVLHTHLPGNTLEQVVITGQKKLRGTGGQSADVLEGRLNELQIGARHLKQTPVIVANLAEMGERYGLRIDGMLGYPFFAGRVTGINFVTGYLTLLEPL